MKISDIISKKVISIYEAKKVGVVENILINKKNINNWFLKIYNETSDLYLLLNHKDIYNIGEQAITIKNTSILNLADNLAMTEEDYYSPLNAKLFDIYGNHVGVINDLHLCEKHKVQTLQIKGSEKLYNIKDILTASSTVAILNDTPPKRRYNFSSKKKIAASTDYKVSIIEKQLNNEGENPSDLAPPLTSIEPVHMQAESSPKRIITDYSFLLNRKITSSIFAQNGEILLKANSIVNASAIAKARLHGKLIELTQKSKTM